MEDMKRQWKLLENIEMKFKTKSKEYETLLKEIKNTLWQELTLVKRRKRLTEELNELWNSEETVTLI